VRSDPTSGSLLDTPPTQIQLSLSESVSLDFSQVQLFDRARTEIKLGPLTRVNGDPNSILAPITEPISSGTYTVVWTALSSTDGHLTEGIFAFRVKGGSDSTEPIVPIAPVAAGPTIPFGTGFDNADPFRWFVRALSLALAVLLLGGAIFTVLVVEPTAAEIEDEGRPATRGQGSGVRGQGSGDDRPPPANDDSIRNPQSAIRNREVASVASLRFAKIGVVAAIMLFVLLLIDLVLQVSSVDRTGFFGAFGRLDSAVLTVQTTRYGFAWLLKIAATLVLTGLMIAALRMQRRNGSWVWEIAQAAASLLFLAEALGSHGAAASESGLTGNLPIPIISYWLHLVTAGAWMGGVIYMALALFPAFRIAGLSREDRRAFLGRSVPRFTRLAITSVIVLGVTGTYNLVIHSVDLGAILSTAYGQLVALKVTAYAVLVAIGAINVRRITPLLRSTGSALKEGVVGPAASLGRNVHIEMALGVVALICAGGLTLLPPPTGATGAGVVASASPITVAQAPTPAPTPGPATVTSEVAGYTFTLTTTPSIDGDQIVLNLAKTDPASPPLTDVAKVYFKITPQDVNGGSISYQATAVGTPGPNKQTWQSTQSFLTLDGGYLVTAIIQRTKSDDMKAAFRLDLSEDTGLKASPSDVVDVLLATDPVELISGTVVLTLTVLDGAHKPIDGAKVTINPAMPAHGHVQPSGVATPVMGRPGIYTLPVQLNMGGSWLLTFTVERAGKQTIKTDASVDVVDPNATPTPAVTPSASP
jgi:putative copper export protein/methionine-rich copper-binding protein CopC